MQAAAPTRTLAFCSVLACGGAAPPAGCRLRPAAAALRCQRVGEAPRCRCFLQDILARNLREGQYFVTGDLTPEIFAGEAGSALAGGSGAGCCLNCFKICSHNNRAAIRSGLHPHPVV